MLKNYPSDALDVVDNRNDVIMDEILQCHIIIRHDVLLPILVICVERIQDKLSTT